MVIPRNLGRVIGLTGLLALLALSPAHATDEATTPPATTGFRLVPVRPPFAKGPLRELDKSRKTVAIETRDGLVSFVLTERTVIFRGPEKLTFDKLATGDILAVRFTTDANGKKMVSHAKVYAPPAGNDDGAATNETSVITRSALPPVSP